MVRLEKILGLGNEGLNILKTIKTESNNEINIIWFRPVDAAVTLQNWLFVFVNNPADPWQFRGKFMMPSSTPIPYDSFSFTQNSYAFSSIFFMATMEI